ncbi:DUF6156 family protein [Endothiovibrio diazotrophicus]
MSAEEEGDWRYFLSYTGVQLPLKLVSPLNDDEVRNRNTYFSARFDGQERLLVVRKVVYGELEMEHRYTYHANGTLSRAEITDECDETRVIEYDEQGQVTAQSG